MLDQDTIPLPPVKVSGNALRDLTKHVRTWTGWADARLILGRTNPKVSPWAMTDSVKREVTVDVDLLLLNPHRVLNTINPFRLRQEAVLTGTLLHEAGHARFTKWVPRTKEAFENFTHSDGKPVTKGVLTFARLVEEPRVEGRMARESSSAGLEWTMRATAAHLLPMTELSADPSQQIMDLIESWTLRAGRQIAMANAMPNYVMPDWVNEFTSLVYNAITQYLNDSGSSVNPISDAGLVMDRLRFMIRSSDDTGTTLVDYARDILGILFPETDEPPTPSGGCGSADEQGEPEKGEGQPEAGDKSEDEAGEGASGGAGEDEDDEQGEGEGEGQSEGSGAESEESETGSGSGSGSASEEGEGEEGETDSTSAVAQALAAMETTADAETEGESKSQPQAEKVPAFGVSTGGTGVPGGAWRTPTGEERDTQRNATKFLRDLINPTERQKVHLSETPSAQVDGAALASWKASGQVTDPMFFLRTRREVMPAPPIKIAVLVDVSGSMDAMQEPSGLLSWALASAAFDLRNFAGRGTQIESTLIHWGDTARVIQPNGVLLPGMRTFECAEGTDAMGEACALVEEQIPGFFDVSEAPENRLLVQFTDWGLSWQCSRGATPYIARAMEAGVNMISVVPGRYWRRNHLDSIMRACPIKRGRNDVVAFNPLSPEAIWDEATKVLGS